MKVKCIIQDAIVGINTDDGLRALDAIFETDIYEFDDDLCVNKIVDEIIVRNSSVYKSFLFPVISIHYL